MKKTSYPLFGPKPTLFAIIEHKLSSHRFTKLMFMIINIAYFIHSHNKNKQPDFLEIISEIERMVMGLAPAATIPSWKDIVSNPMPVHSLKSITCLIAKSHLFGVSLNIYAHSYSGNPNQRQQLSCSLNYT